MDWTLALTKLQPRLIRMCFVTFLANLIALPSGTFEGLATTILSSRSEADFLARTDSRMMPANPGTTRSLRVTKL